MRAAAVLLVALALPAAGQITSGVVPMSTVAGSGSSTPATCTTAGMVPIFLGSPVALGCDAGLTYAAATDTLTVAGGVTAASYAGALFGVTAAGEVRIGSLANQSNTGAYSVGIGYAANQSNTGTNPVGIGYYANHGNAGANPVGIGAYANQYNIGTSPVGIGAYANQRNNWPNAISIGGKTAAYWASNAATARAFTDAEITANTITFTAPHGFPDVGAKRNLMFTTTAGTPPTGLVSGTVYVFTITSTSVVTLSGIGTNASVDFAGTLTDSVDITNSIALGFDANASAPNQATLGNSSVTSFLVGGGSVVKITPGHINLPNVLVYADNAAALAGGLVAGDIYRTSTGVLMIVF